MVCMVAKLSMGYNMENKWKIIKDDKSAVAEHLACAYCKHFFCTKYHYPRNRMVCTHGLPHWDFLYRLMRDVAAIYTCKKFEMHKLYKEKMKYYQK